MLGESWFSWNFQNRSDMMQWIIDTFRWCSGSPSGHKTYLFVGWYGWVTVNNIMQTNRLSWNCQTWSTANIVGIRECYGSPSGWTQDFLFKCTLASQLHTSRGWREDWASECVWFPMLCIPFLFIKSDFRSDIQRNAGFWMRKDLFEFISISLIHYHSELHLIWGFIATETWCWRIGFITHVKSPNS